MNQDAEDCIFLYVVNQYQFQFVNKFIHNLFSLSTHIRFMNEPRYINKNGVS